MSTGTALSFFGEEASTSYLKGVKMAVSDYYNDQIREIYEFKPDEVELKEVYACWSSARTLAS